MLVPELVWVAEVVVPWTADVLVVAVCFLAFFFLCDFFFFGALVVVVGVAAAELELELDLDLLPQPANTSAAARRARSVRLMCGRMVHAPGNPYTLSRQHERAGNSARA